MKVEEKFETPKRWWIKPQDTGEKAYPKMGKNDGSIKMGDIISIGIIKEQHS